MASPIIPAVFASPFSRDTDAPSPAKKSGTLLSKGKELFKSPSKRKEQKGKEKAESLVAQEVGLASLAEDAWFLSDYLSHHLFRGLGEHMNPWVFHLLMFFIGVD